MQVFKSKVNTSVPDFKANHDGLLALCNQLQERLRLSLDQGPAPLVARHVKGGKLLARDRIELLLDQDSPFLELMPLAGWDQDAALGGSIVAGIGLVSGVECLISASVPTIKGGAVNEITLAKTARLSQIANENCLPSISLVQSAGADLSQQEKVRPGLCVCVCMHLTLLLLLAGVSHGRRYIPRAREAKQKGPHECVRGVW